MDKLTTPEYSHNGQLYGDDNVIYSFKGRGIDIKKPIFVYKNLHNKMYSVKQCGLVVAHAERICISRPEFIVRQSGRKRVLKEKRKNVHAFIKGIYSGSVFGTTAERNDLPMKIEYDPYKYNSFMCTNLIKTPYRVTSCGGVIIDKNGVRGGN